MTRKYNQIVREALSTIDSTETELRRFARPLPTESDWQAFHGYHNRLKAKLGKPQ